jgi:hypothetical protein
MASGLPDLCLGFGSASMDPADRPELVTRHLRVRLCLLHRSRRSAGCRYSVADPVVVRRRDSVVLSAPVVRPSTSASHSARICRGACTASNPSRRRWLGLGTWMIDPSGTNPHTAPRTRTEDDVTSRSLTHALSHLARRSWSPGGSSGLIRQRGCSWLPPVEENDGRSGQRTLPPDSSTRCSGLRGRVGVIRQHSGYRDLFDQEWVPPSRSTR